MVALRGSRWLILLRPKWLAWHLFAVLAVAGMLYLGDWQLHRALAGNQLSWAYTFEWPIFAVCGVVFWVKSVREELSLHGSAGSPEPVTAQEQPADDEAVADAYLARLKAEVQGHGRWHGMR
jgi:hypothetical protein